MTQVTTTNGNGNGTTQQTGLTIGNRVLANRRSPRGQLQTMHLEEVRDHLVKLNMLQRPEDRERSLDQLSVDFASGHMEARFLDRNSPDGREPTRYLVTEVGAQNLAREVLPSRFFPGLRELATMDTGGGKVATLAWAKFASRCSTPRKVRTVLMKVGNEIHPVIRSCHSQDYAPYSNLEFVQDILNNGGAFANMPVMDWRVEDNAMRLRFAGCPAEQIEPHKVIPMVEGWNSEVGLRRVGLRGGMWKLICTNGMGHWADRTEYNWIHRGNAERIRSGVKSAFQNLLTAAGGVVDAYNEALNIGIDDAYKFLQAELEDRVPERVINDAKKALSAPEVTPRGLLASVVDAITWVAQNELDMLQQYEVERVAADVLQHGRAIALQNGGHIPVES